MISLVMPELDPGIHRKKRFIEEKWIAGSSPAMTADGSVPPAAGMIRRHP
jgi:hypothetical protein